MLKRLKLISLNIKRKMLSRLSFPEPISEGKELAPALTTSKGPTQTETTDYGVGLSMQTTTDGRAGRQGHAPTGFPGTGLMHLCPTGGIVPQPMPIGGPGDCLHGHANEDEEDEEALRARAERAGGMDC
ncbi:hypothetical protein KSP39_PZI017876 [Platanthera zijinensis]|uniref:Uncharacterized protein n=1 Tax=Platanthera zijinensis TaxID=2320716 RepID=A0AAP0B580_9ASPA